MSYPGVQERTADFSSSSTFLPKVKSRTCTKCSSIFSDGFSLQEHLHRVHNIVMEYVCTICGKGYHTQSGLYYHMQSWHTKAVHCPVCPSQFRRKGTMKRHMLTIHNMKQCLHCSQFIYSFEFELHSRSCGMKSA